MKKDTMKLVHDDEIKSSNYNDFDYMNKKEKLKL